MPRAISGILWVWACVLGVVVTGCGPVNPEPFSEGLQSAPAADQPSSEEAVAAEVASDEPGDSESSPEMPPLQLTDEQLAEGWVSLFDGRTLFGWNVPDEADWRIEEDSLLVRADQPVALLTSAQFADYVVRMEVKSEPGASGGLLLHAPAEVVDAATESYRLNLAGGSEAYPAGSLVGRKRAEAEIASEEWQQYEIRVVGETVEVSVAGEALLTYDAPEPLRLGHLGLQIDSGQLAVRNFWLQPRGLESIFNHEDLTGWVTFPERESRFTVTDEGWMHVQDGPGQLETEQSYGDFVLQLQCKTHAPELNSGIFFRCIPGDPMNGYESQIHNGIVDGDRSRPVDCGTGGIFRRQDARFVAADDATWFYKTILVVGPHMTVWVNGLQVSDWTDQREPDENPRRGLRLEPGTIQIQGHDPTTDISFREFWVAELPSRSAP